MPTGQVQLFLRDVWRLHPNITGSEFGFLGEFLQLLCNSCTFWQPKREARPNVFRVNRIEAHFGPDFPMVSPLGLLQHLEIGLELCLVLESSAINALQL